MGIQKRLAFEPVDSIDTAFTDAGGRHPIPCGLNRPERWRKGQFSFSQLELRYPSSLVPDITAPHS